MGQVSLAQKGGDRFFRSGKIPPVGTATVVSQNPINQLDVGTAFPPPYLWDEIRISLGYECRLFNIAHIDTICLAWRSRLGTAAGCPALRRGGLVARPWPDDGVRDPDGVDVFTDPTNSAVEVGDLNRLAAEDHP